MDTFKYTLKRLVWALVTLFVLFTIIFILVKMLPIPEGGMDEAEIARRAALGHGEPVMYQYWIYLRNIITRWDWGTAWAQPGGMQYATSVLLDRLPPSILINIYSFVIAVPLGLLLGIFIGQLKGRWQDHTYGVIIMVVIALPSFVFAFVLQYFIAFQLGWFTFLVEPIDTAGSWFAPQMIWSMILPVLAMAIPTIAIISRTVRAELVEQLNSDYMLLARCKGLTVKQATRRHSFKNAMVPILPIIVSMFVLSLSAGSIVIEQIFAIPGTGTLYIQSLNTLDYDVFMITTMFFIMITLLAGLLSDLSFSFLDPRIKVR